MTRKLIIDTSALISLGHTDLVEEIISNYEIIVSKGVIEELKEISRIDDLDGVAAKRWLEKIKQITIQNVIRKDSAEDELMIICLKKNIPLFLDDIKATKRIDKKIKWFFSVHIVFLLFYNGIITKERAKINIIRMRTVRHWKDNAISIMARSLFE